METFSTNNEIEDKMAELKLELPDLQVQTDEEIEKNVNPFVLSQLKSNDKVLFAMKV